MSPVTFAIWVLVGLLAGLLAGFVTKRGGYGWKGDVLGGLAGSLGAGGFCWAMGISRGLLAVVVTFVGAAMVIALQRWLLPARGGRAAEGAVPGRRTRPVWGVER